MIVFCDRECKHNNGNCCTQSCIWIDEDGSCEEFEEQEEEEVEE